MAPCRRQFVRRRSISCHLSLTSTSKRPREPVVSSEALFYYQMPPPTRAGNQERNIRGEAAPAVLRTVVDTPSSLSP